MTRKCWIIVLVCAVTALAGCETAQEVFGRNKKAPDEFAVYTRAPLTLPPEYGLRPPKPGAPRPQSVDPRSRAKRATMFSGRSGRPGPLAKDPEGPVSRGTEALLRQVGVDTATPDIRQIVNREAPLLDDEDQGDDFTDRLMFWRTRTETATNTVVDPERESKRIQENLALGKPITAGKTPIIERKKANKGLLGNLFD